MAAGFFSGQGRMPGNDLKASILGHEGIMRSEMGISTNSVELLLYWPDARGYFFVQI